MRIGILFLVLLSACSYYPYEPSGRALFLRHCADSNGVFIEELDFDPRTADKKVERVFKYQDKLYACLKPIYINILEK